MDSSIACRQFVRSFSQTTAQTTCIRFARCQKAAQTTSSATAQATTSFEFANPSYDKAVVAQKSVYPASRPDDAFLCFSHSTTGVKVAYLATIDPGKFWKSMRLSGSSFRARQRDRRTNCPARFLHQRTLTRTNSVSASIQAASRTKRTVGACTRSHYRAAGEFTRRRRVMELDANTTGSHGSRCARRSSNNRRHVRPCCVCVWCTEA